MLKHSSQDIFFNHLGHLLSHTMKLLCVRGILDLLASLPEKPHGEISYSRESGSVMDDRPVAAFKGVCLHNEGNLKRSTNSIKTRIWDGRHLR